MGAVPILNSQFSISADAGKARAVRLLVGEPARPRLALLELLFARLARAGERQRPESRLGDLDIALEATAIVARLAPADGRSTCLI